MLDNNSDKIFAHIIAIGDELLIGQVIDTNSSFIAKELNKVGVEVVKISSISDKEEEIIKNIESAALQNTHFIITTGGLGPTKDDITKHTLAKMFGVQLFRSEEVYKHIENLFASYNLVLNNYSKTQADLPTATIPLHNSRGTAPGMWTKYKNSIVINLPGVPKEMKGLIEEQVIPKIQKEFKMPHILHRTILSVGIPESLLAENLHEWEINLPKELKLAYLPHGVRVRLRISGYSSNLEELENLVSKKEQELIQLLGVTHQPYSDEPIEKQIYSLLTDKKLTISVAESCTGGAISAKIVSQQGASSIYMGGVVAYANQIKINELKVNSDTIKEYGAVSEQTVAEMAKNICQIYKTDIGLATSGIAPSFGVKNEEQGKVYIAVCYKEKVTVINHKLINLTRKEFIDSVVEKALQQVIHLITEV